jgi:spore cortex formation protein SpoVR/YcgB (stage V sporulation)
MFERASRLKLRFSSSIGYLMTEDLWDVAVAILDDMWKALNKELKAEKEESLLATRSQAKTELTLKVDLLKYIVTTKLAEKQAKESRAEKKEKRKQILALMADKENAALANKSVEDLQKELEALEEDD